MGGSDLTNPQLQMHHNPFEAAKLEDAPQVQQPNPPRFEKVMLSDQINFYPNVNFEAPKF